MRYFAFAFTTILATLAAVLLCNMGIDYIDPEIGRGLHPAIAFPLATLVMCAVGVLGFLLFSTEDEPKYISDELDDLMVKRY